MKIMFYALRPFDEQAYCEPYSKQYGIDYAYTAEVPTPDNLELAKGCDAVSTNPCLITPEYLEAWAAMGVKFLPCRSIGYDHIPQQKAKELGMRISHSWYPPAGVADYAIMLMLMCNRKVGQILRRADAQYDGGCDRHRQHWPHCAAPLERLWLQAAGLRPVPQR